LLGLATRKGCVGEKNKSFTENVYNVLDLNDRIKKKLFVKEFKI
jgi:hypothetical protein